MKYELPNYLKILNDLKTEMKKHVARPSDYRWEVEIDRWFKNNFEIFSVEKTYTDQVSRHATFDVKAVLEREASYQLAAPILKTCAVITKVPKDMIPDSTTNKIEVCAMRNRAKRY